MQALNLYETFFQNSGLKFCDFNFFLKGNSNGYKAEMVYYLQFKSA